ncbi:MAG: alpha/beta hydrolase [Flavobacteriales bacterium]|nr:alpha/beta hydrolase [Flavobacteriales bacterium]
MKLLTRIIKAVVGITLLLVLLLILFFGHKDIPMDQLKEKYANEASSFIEIDEMNVHYRDEGNPSDSIPLVLIHGTGSSLHTFDVWASELKKERRVIRMDLPAFGLTGPFPDGEYPIEQYVFFIEHFLSKIGVNKCIIGGNSLGGEIAWRFTVKNPNTVQKLVLINAAGYPMTSKSVPVAFKMARLPVINKLFTFITPRFMVQKSVENVYADKEKVTEGLVDRYFDLSLRAGNRQAFVDRLSLERDAEPIDLIKNIEQATLILWGMEDLLIPVENAQLFHDDLPNNSLVIMDKVGHVPMEELPLESLAILQVFLNTQ